MKTNPFGEARQAGGGRSYSTMAKGDTMHIVGSSPTAPDKLMNLEKTDMGFELDFMNAANASRSDRAIAMNAGWYWDRAGNFRIGTRNDVRDSVKVPIEGAAA